MKVAKRIPLWMNIFFKKVLSDFQYIQLADSSQKSIVGGKKLQPPFSSIILFPPSGPTLYFSFYIFL